LKRRIPQPVLEEARQRALQAADAEESPPLSESKERRIKRKVIAALKKLHPMD
jgi:hypothetical protein